MSESVLPAETSLDALRSIMGECEGHRHGERAYDLTLDHIYDCAEVAREDIAALVAELERSRTTERRLRVLAEESKGASPGWSHLAARLREVLEGEQ